MFEYPDWLGCNGIGIFQNYANRPSHFNYYSARKRNIGWIRDYESNHVIKMEPELLEEHVRRNQLRSLNTDVH